MATVTTDTDFDTLSRAATENITVSNGATLTIDVDVRYSAGAPAAGAGTIGDVSLSASTPGTVHIEGRNVWWLPFDSGTDFVPGYNAVISGQTSGATGVFMNLTSGLAFAPLASGSAMPTTGFIKLKSKDKEFSASETLTADGVEFCTATTAGQTGWIEVPMRETDAWDIGGNGTLSISGSWFYLDDTDGTAGQIIQAPTYGGSNTYYPAIWIETGVGTGEFESWLAIYAGGTSPWKTDASGGITTDIRGKYVESLSSARFRIGHDGTDNVGYVPVSGLRTRIPNVFLVNTASAGTPQSNAVPHSTMTTRPDFATASPGEVRIDGALSNWYFYLNRFRAASIKNFGTFDMMYFLYVAEEFILDNVAIGSYRHYDTYPFRIGSCTLGGTINNLNIGRAAASPTSGDYGLYVDSCSNVVLNNSKLAILAPRAGSLCLPLLFNSNGGAISNCTIIGGSAKLSGGSIVASGIIYCDNIYGDTDSANGVNGIIYAYSLNDSTISNISLLSGVTNVHPNGYIVYGDLCDNLRIQNIGTRDNPFDHGTVNNGAFSFFINNNSSSSNIRIRRCYTQNAGTSFFRGGTYSNFVWITNCAGNYTDNMQTTIYVPSNMRIKNLAAASWGTTNTLARGTHFHNLFVNTVSGRLGVAFNEPNAASADYCVLTEADPTSFTGWTREGTLNMRAAGDTVEYTWPYKVLGVNGFQSSDGVLTGTNTSNHDFYYAIKYPTDTAYSAWKAASSANLSAETPSASAGFYMKFLISGNTSSSTNALTSAYLLTYCSGTAQDVLYPLEENFTTITTDGLLADSRIQIYNVDQSLEIANEVVSSGEFSITFDSFDDGAVAVDGETIRLRATKLGYLPYDVLGAFSDNGLSFIVAQEVDDVYVTNGIDGSTVTEFALDLPNIQIDLNDPDGETTIQRGYAWFNYILTTESGIRSAYGGFTAVDEVNYLANSDLIDFQFDNVNSDPLHITGGYVYRSDGGQIIASGSGPLFLDAGKAYLASPSSSAITSGVWNEVLEGTLTAKDVQRILLAVAAGITNITDLGGGAATVKFYGQDDTTERVVATMSGSARTDVTVNGV